MSLASLVYKYIGRVIHSPKDSGARAPQPWILLIVARAVSVYLHKFADPNEISEKLGYSLASDSGEVSFETDCFSPSPGMGAP